MRHRDLVTKAACAALALLAASRVAHGEVLPPPSAPAALVDCTRRPPRAPPDLRCGETLDGRPPPGAPVPIQISRALLMLPRMVLVAAVAPVVVTSQVVERDKWPQRVYSWLTTDDGKIGVRPELLYATGFRPTVGARAFDERHLGPGSRVEIGFRTAGLGVIMGTFVLEPPGDLGLRLAAVFDRRDDRLFAGIGPLPRSEVADPNRVARYASDDVDVRLGVQRRLSGPVFGGVHGGALWRDYGTDVRSGTTAIDDVYGLGAAAPGLVDPASVPGFETGVRQLHGGATLGFSWGENGRTASGLTVTTEGWFREGVSGDPSRFVGASGVIVGGVGLGVDRKLLLRARAALVEALDDRPIPFDEYPTPTGRDGLRGFAFGRIRAPSAGVATAEYRWLWSSYADTSLFVDYGGGFGPRFSDLTFDNSYVSYGIGFRFLQREDGRYWIAHPFAGIQIAYAPEGDLRVQLGIASF